MNKLKFKKHIQILSIIFVIALFLLIISLQSNLVNDENDENVEHTVMESSQKSDIVNDENVKHTVMESSQELNIINGENTEHTETEAAESNLESVQKMAIFDNAFDIFMNNSEKGWVLREDGSFLLTEDGWETYKQLIQFDKNELVMHSISFAENTLFISGALTKKQSIVIYSSKDDGYTWNESYIDYLDKYYTPTQVFCSFIDSKNGYIFSCGGPAIGLMPKMLYKTNDGGISFEEIGDISHIKGYPTGITFDKNGNGFITSTYHGNDNSYLYISKDQGITWDRLIIINTKEPYYGYIDGYPICFLNQKGYIIIKCVGRQLDFMVLDSSDDGELWIQNGTVEIESISNYSFGDANTLYIIDSSGNMYKKIRQAMRWK